MRTETPQGASRAGRVLSAPRQGGRRLTDRAAAAPLLERDRELARIRDLLTAAAAGRGGALVVEGEAGIGKSALIGHALADRSDLAVVRVMGISSEADSGGAGLERLILGLRALPGGERAVAELQARRYAEPFVKDADPVAAAHRLHGVLEGCTGGRPLAIVFDDYHWLDQATRLLCGALAQRLSDLPVAMLIATRNPSGAPDLPATDRIQLGGLRTVHVGRLAAAAASWPVSPGVTATISWAAAGNPQAVSDIVANLSMDQLSGRVPLSPPFLVGDDLASAFAGCVPTLGEANRRAVLLAALTGGRAGVLQRALESAGLTMADLDPAEDAGLLRLGSSRVAFRHPLGRAAAYTAASPSERRWARTVAAGALSSEAGELTLIADERTSPSGRPAPAGGHAPVGDEGHGKDYSVQLLGSFAVHRLASEVTPSQAQPAQAVKVVALRRQIAVDELVEALWPGAEPGVGRVRLRNVLSRVRDTCPDLLLRDGELVSIGPAVSVDVHDFEKEALAVLAGGEADSSREAVVERATLALALYTGELLPMDRYAVWASVERERLADRHRELLGVLVDRYEESGNVAAAVRLLEDAIALEPYDEHLYIRAADLMGRLGWRSRALQMLRRAEAVAADLGVSPSRRIAALRERLGAA